MGDDGVEEFPHRVGDRTIVAVDEQKLALVICLFGMAGEMNLTDVLTLKWAVPWVDQARCSETSAGS